MEAVKINNSIPDPLAPWDEKTSDAYGLSFARIISSDWFGGGFAVTGTQFANRREYVRRKRLFVRGEHDPDYFKNQMGKNEGALDYINLDWSNINWAEKFCRIVSNGLSDKNYKLDVRATDKLSSIKKGKQKDYYLREMKSRKMLQNAQKELGLDLLPKTFIPEDEEEMQMFMEIKERPRIEIAEEILIDYIFNTNEWNFLEGQFAKDLVDVGLIVGRVYTDKNDGVKLAYVDCENYVHSRVTRNDFADKKYEGYVESISIHDIVRESDGKFTSDEIRKIAKSYGKFNKSTITDYDGCAIEQLLAYQIDVLRFAFKTRKTITYKKKIRKGEAIKVSRKPDTYKAPDAEDVSAISGDFDTWFEGNYIIGTDMIYGYRECENQYDDIMNKAMSPYITFAYDIYENRLRSFTDNIEAPARQLQKISLKIQHLVSELTPDMMEVDLDQLAELDDGKGGVKKEVWQTAMTLMKTKGIIFKKRIDMGESGMKDTAAVRPAGSNQGSALTVLLNTWAHYYNLIRENTGVNPARDGSMSPDSLVGVNELANLASNTVTANIVETSVMFKKKLSECISTRLHSIFSYKEAAKIKEIYVNVVGRQMIDYLEVMKDRHLHEFGFTFEMNPTAQELKEFSELITIGVTEGTVDIEVANQAKEIAKVNTKKAIQYLMYSRRKRIKQRAEEQMMLARDKSQNDSNAAQVKIQADIQAYQAKKEIDFNFEKRMAQVRLMEAEANQQVSLPKEQREFEQEVYLKKIEGMTSLRKEEYKEDRKDDRTGIQATQQSKMKQAKENDAPIDFQNEANWFEN